MTKPTWLDILLEDAKTEAAAAAEAAAAKAEAAAKAKAKADKTDADNAADEVQHALRHAALDAHEADGYPAVTALMGNVSAFIKGGAKPNIDPYPALIAELGSLKGGIEKLMHQLDAAEKAKADAEAKAAAAEKANSDFQTRLDAANAAVNETKEKFKARLSEAHETIRILRKENHQLTDDAAKIEELIGKLPELNLSQTTLGGRAAKVSLMDAEAINNTRSSLRALFKLDEPEADDVPTDGDEPTTDAALPTEGGEPTS